MTDSHTNSVCQDGSEIASASISETGAVPGDDRVGLTSKQLFVVKAGDGSVYAGELRRRRRWETVRRRFQSPLLRSSEASFSFLAK